MARHSVFILFLFPLFAHTNLCTTIHLSALRVFLLASKHMAFQRSIVLFLLRLPSMGNGIWLFFFFCHSGWDLLQREIELASGIRGAIKHTERARGQLFTKSVGSCNRGDLVNFASFSSFTSSSMEW
jgi:hypothetical protein